MKSTDIKSTGKFTTANFRETTITPSPANIGDFSSPGSTSSTGGGGSTPTQEKERDAKEQNREEKEAKRKENKRQDKGKQYEKSSDSGLSLTSEYEEVDKKHIDGILGNPSGRSVAAVKEKVSVYPVTGGDGKIPKVEKSPISLATSNCSVVLSSASITTMATTVTTTTPVTTQGSSNSASSTASNASTFSYSFESFLSNRNETEKMEQPLKVEAQAAVPPLPSKRQRSR